MEWDESKHLRDRSGKFTDGTTDYKYPQYLARVNGHEGREKGTTAAIGFANKERKNTKHHLRHAREMGYKNQDEYERAAVEFFNGNQGVLYYSERRDRFYRYDEKSQKFAVCDKEGILHTFDFRTPKEFEKIKKQDILYET